MEDGWGGQPTRSIWYNKQPRWAGEIWQQWSEWESWMVGVQWCQLCLHLSLSTFIYREGLRKSPFTILVNWLVDVSVASPTTLTDIAKATPWASYCHNLQNLLISFHIITVYSQISQETCRWIITKSHTNFTQTLDADLTTRLTTRVRFSAEEFFFSLRYRIQTGTVAHQPPPRG